MENNEIIDKDAIIEKYNSIFRKRFKFDSTKKHYDTQESYLKDEEIYYSSNLLNDQKFESLVEGGTAIMDSLTLNNIYYGRYYNLLENNLNGIKIFFYHKGTKKNIEIVLMNEEIQYDELKKLTPFLGMPILESMSVHELYSLLYKVSRIINLDIKQLKTAIELRDLNMKLMSSIRKYKKQQKVLTLK